MVIPEPLSSFLSTYCDVELFWQGWHDGVRKYFETFPDRKPVIQRQFAELITREDLDLEAYRKLTNHRFADAVLLGRWLRELWVEMFGNVPVPGDD